MMKKIFFYSFLGLIGLATTKPLSGFAQTVSTTTVRGHIQDEKNAAAAFASVTLRQTSDSNLVKGALTDSLGNFIIAAIKPGHYFVRVQQTGSTQAYSKAFDIKEGQENMTVPTLNISFQANNLKEVNVTAAKALIEHKPGQTIVNVANSSLSAGNSVMEVLEKSPGVLIDKDDNISLNGKGGVMVMINGRPSHMASTQLASILKGMPAASVSKIELMTQPPAKYSAEGSAGIINIVLKQQVPMGLNGSLTAGAGYGQYWKYNGGGNINYRSKKISIYGSYNYDHRKDKFEMGLTRNFYNPTTNVLESFMQQNSEIIVDGNHHNAQVGLDYTINNNQTIGFVANGDFNKGNFNSFSPVHFNQPSGHTDSTVTSNNHNGYNWENESGNLHYTLKLDKKGSNLAINADYSHFYQSMPQSTHTQTTDNQGELVGNPILRRGEQPNEINIYAAKADYTGILNNNFKLEAGIKSSYVKTDNQSIFDINDSGPWQADNNMTNHFIYKENINAGYLTLSKEFKKGWNANVGLRAEQTNIETHQLIGDSSNTNNYFDLFPNASLSKTINPNNVLSLSYSRRIDRPDYQSLNPFIYYVDEYTYKVGNPYLKPQYTNLAELAYTFKHRYTATLSYSHTKDIMSMVSNINNQTHVGYITMDNISKLDNLNLNLSIPISITKWWQTYNSVQGSHNHYNGLYDGYPLDKGYFSFMGSTYQSFILPHSWKAELTGMYRSSMIMGPIIVGSMGMVSAGIEKSIWKGKASIKLNVQDIFQSMNFTGKVDFGNLHARTSFKGYRRAANLTFTWHFGNQKIRVKKYNNTSIKEDEKRIKKGNGNGGM